MGVHATSAPSIPPTISASAGSKHKSRSYSRMTYPSSRFASPLLSIDPSYFFLGNQASETAIIVRMGRDSHSKSLFGGVGDKQFFTSYANALTTVLGVNLGRVRLKPRPVAFKSLILFPSLLQLNRIGYLFHDN